MENIEKCDIIISGVGGQGIVLASRLIATMALKKDYKISTAETIGMSQRGGSVVSNLRLDSHRKGSLIPKGQANVIIGFEPAEAYRYNDYLNSNANVLLNSNPIYSSSKTLENEIYSQNEVNKIIKIFKINSKLTVCNFNKMASDFGNLKTMNIMMIAVACLCNYLPFSIDDLKNTINTEMPNKIKDINLKAVDFAIENFKRY
ncbi:2-oxoacid:acceptor oxidoreductase family protein [Methanococcus voltae]|uniref:Indolepyruvate ferredoxin oxidoreductase n=1 Tax=Methanococcus voltae (strain ATCC BAA-1334 / A3) TaxID=456320 RepID=D7DR85_METV3|nr:2-oxoacid:acceptor oxidoreductase family protein [Methanococcus voltae]MCS3901022.1 indolepyruvate ferredoxin oxidoreductase beta subunit [Methanococcus voltae]